MSEKTFNMTRAKDVIPCNPLQRKGLRLQGRPRERNPFDINGLQKTLKIYLTLNETIV